ncbi:MAG: hypothetical protein SF097_17155 [Acidobacteriota bacterium]|nr:hypothetical protein [Acidobacteriota bacterium]
MADITVLPAIGCFETHSTQNKLRGDFIIVTVNTLKPFTVGL